MFASPLAVLILLALPWLGVLSQPSLAHAEARSQDGTRMPSKDADRFRGMDRNGDGIITRDEWRGSTQSFRMHDWNRDGVLSGDEVRTGALPTGRREDEDYDPESSEQVNDWTVEAFNNLDHNRDGRITRNEWHGDLETFRRIDRNGNNSISRAEFLGGDDDDVDRHDTFANLDVDRDGRVERDEWQGSRAAFDQLDRNRDGVLSRREVIGTMTAAQTDTFASLDYNRNGIITPDEWHWSRRSFDARDLDGDGTLTRAEFRAAPRPRTTEDVARASNESRVVTVDAQQRWTNTGLHVRAGDTISFQAEGSVRMSDDPRDIATPAGSQEGRRAPNAPVREALAGGLLMKVGESVVYVGARGTFGAPATGELLLGINDDHLPDNAGAFRVTISVQGR